MLSCNSLLKRKSNVKESPAASFGKSTPTVHAKHLLQKVCLVFQRKKDNSETINFQSATSHQIHEQKVPGFWTPILVPHAKQAPPSTDDLINLK